VAKRSFEETTTAHHEAAHAVAAVTLGMPGKIKLVTIEDDDEAEGRVTFVDPNAGPANRDEAHDYILQNLVGAQAEARIRHGVEEPIGAAHDYERAGKAALKFGMAKDSDFPNGPA
jgi:ATP-dependent Zn protease